MHFEKSVQTISVSSKIMLILSLQHIPKANDTRFLKVKY